MTYYEGAIPTGDTNGRIAELEQRVEALLQLAAHLCQDADLIEKHTGRRSTSTVRTCAFTYTETKERK
jgi:hypothetical protein